MQMTKTMAYRTAIIRHNHNPDIGCASSHLTRCGRFARNFLQVALSAAVSRSRPQLELLFGFEKWTLFLKPAPDRLHNPLRAMTVSVRILAFRHVLIGACI